MAKIIGTYEARTHWSEVIQEVKRGEHYVITHHGEPIAELVPPAPRRNRNVPNALRGSCSNLWHDARQ